ncbi:MAG TPA: sugar phosphate nucleotidyltransferase [Verrucomicrobiae bacterium]|nr:sugar phosphate nucleotidyltransferase [Verrucomicrobiae bacterium]
MKIRKAVITAAAPSQRTLPLQRLVDRDGQEKSALQVLIEEVVSAGVEEIAIVICPGDETPYREAAQEHAPRLTFTPQADPRGYGHALWCASEFTARDPFLHLVGDHLYLSREKRRCAQQLIEVATSQSCTVSAVQATRESMLPYYGTVGGHRIPRSRDLYQIERVAEKPTPTEAEQTLNVPGLRAGHYLCLFGMHVLNPAIMDILRDAVARTAADEKIGLSPALSELARRERYLALEVRGDRYNIGVKYGLLMAQLALALAGNDRDMVLAQLVEHLASGHMQPIPPGT